VWLLSRYFGAAERLRCGNSGVEWFVCQATAIRLRAADQDSLMKPTARWPEMLPRPQTWLADLLRRVVGKFCRAGSGSSPYGLVTEGCQRAGLVHGAVRGLELGTDQRRK